MLDWIKGLHSAEGISGLIQAGGLYAITSIVFAETGLLVGFFLPGDSLLITAGVLSNSANPNHVPTLSMVTLNFVLVCAAICGNQMGYFLGTRAGDRVWSRPDGRFYKRKHLESAQAFYSRHGGLAVIAARYVPILRTFVPFAAGMAKMNYRKFLLWDIAGGVLWISSLLWIGYFLGQTQLANRLDKLIVLVVIVSLLPIALGALKGWVRQRRAHSLS